MEASNRFFTLSAVFLNSSLVSFFCSKSSTVIISAAKALMVNHPKTNSPAIITFSIDLQFMIFSFHSFGLRVISIILLFLQLYGYNHCLFFFPPFMVLSLLPAGLSPVSLFIGFYWLEINLDGWNQWTQFSYILIFKKMPRNTQKLLQSSNSENRAWLKVLFPVDLIRRLSK